MLFRPSVGLATKRVLELREMKTKLLLEQGEQVRAVFAGRCNRVLFVPVHFAFRFGCVVFGCYVCRVCGMILLLAVA